MFGDFAFNRVGWCNPIEQNITNPQLGPWFGSEPVTWPLVGSSDPCKDSADCSIGTESCHKGVCDEPATCITSDDCPEGISCSTDQCLQYCATDAECGEGIACFGWCAERTQQDQPFLVGVTFERQHNWFTIGEDNNDNGIRLDPKDIGVKEEDDGDFDVRVHQADDLSWPVAPVHADTVTFHDEFGDFVVQPYLLDRPPYYVRVSAREGGQPPVTIPPTGLSTTLIFRKNQCTDPLSDVCVLTPGVTATAGWPGPDKYNYAWDFTPNAGDPSDLSQAACAAPGPPANMQSPYHFDYMYFRFFVDAALRAGGATLDPNVDFAITNSDGDQFDLGSQQPGLGIRIYDASSANPAGNAPFNVKLCDCGDPLCPPSQTFFCNTSVSGAGFPTFFAGQNGGEGTLVTDNENNGALAPGAPGVMRPFILRIHRTEGVSTMSDMTVTMLSSMTLVHTTSLTILKKGDKLSRRDEVGVFVRHDGDPLPACDGALAWTADFYQSLHENEPMTDGFFYAQAHPEVTMPLAMRVCEDGDGSSDLYGPDAFISPLEQGEQPHKDGDDATQWNFCDNWPTCADADHHYLLTYRRTHEDMGAEDAGGDPTPPVCP